MNVRWILLCLGALASCAGTPAAPAVSVSGVATLGVETSVPSQKKVREMGLPEMKVRQQGREVDKVEAGGAAEHLGLAKGDVILELDGVALYSQDDVDDILSVHRPGDEIAIVFQPNGDRGVIETTVVLGADDTLTSAEMPGLTWHCASLAQLGEAQERARAEGKGILVGLSGAET